ncbi:RAB6-interacting golgin [Helicoverpa armigera]|uniref:RAB6-interacting golgin n=1 Tax=Helicoverpa armigera TaxID=29058 RepID=UPI003082C6B1
MSTFSGFSEEELKRIKSGETGSNSAPQINTTNVKKLDKLGFRPKRVTSQYKLPILQKHNSDDAIDDIEFDKCKLSLRSPTTPVRDITETSNDNNKENLDKNDNIKTEFSKENNTEPVNTSSNKMVDENKDTVNIDRKNSTDVTPDIVRGVDNYSADELENHKVKLEELQLRQKLMEEQNKKRKEMLAKALADRTKQTTEEVMRLEKIKKELQVLDSQFSQDVAVLRQKIDQACLSYADAEKHYLKVEKEFLQAKIHLQKEKEKKELLTEHLCALITHNETRKAQKLETLMLELATDKKVDQIEVSDVKVEEKDESPVIVDGVDERTGKMVEFTPES